MIGTRTDAEEPGPHPIYSTRPARESARPPGNVGVSVGGATDVWGLSSHRSVGDRCGGVCEKGEPMGMFGRRRQGIAARSAQEGPASASILHADEALQAFEDLFVPPPPPRPLLRPPASIGDDPIARLLDAPVPERGPSLDSTLVDHDEHEGVEMTHLQDAVQQLLAIDGVIGVAIVDSASGMALAEGGHPAFDLSVAAAGNSNVVRAKLQTMKELGITSALDDILITLDDQYHLINVLGGGNAGLFVYLVLDRAEANLALARHKLAGIAADITI